MLYSFCIVFGTMKSVDSSIEFQHFSSSLHSFCNKPNIYFIKAWQKIQSSLNHKSFQPNSESHQKFLANLLMKLEVISSQINVSEELEMVKKQLI